LGRKVMIPGSRSQSLDVPNRRYSVLFVCTGNICRSPLAEGVFRSFLAQAGLVDRVTVDSAATHDYQFGQTPDPRAVAAAARRGYDLPPRRARTVNVDDFARFDMILAMDRSNLEVLEALRPRDYDGFLGLLLDFAPGLPIREVPDPYNCNPERFEYVLDLIERGDEGLFETIRAGIVAQRHPVLPAAG
jgi:protein-tyrosine phosphatase